MFRGGSFNNSLINTPLLPIDMRSTLALFCLVDDPVVRPMLRREVRYGMSWL
jgi:hypothetical protein